MYRKLVCEYPSTYTPGTNFDTLTKEQLDELIQSMYLTSDYTYDRKGLSVSSNNCLTGDGTLIVKYINPSVEAIEYFTSKHPYTPIPISDKTAFEIPKDCKIWIGLESNLYQDTGDEITAYGINLQHIEVKDGWTTSEKGSYRLYKPDSGLDYKSKIPITGDLDIIKAVDLQIGEYNNFQVENAIPQWVMTELTEESLSSDSDAVKYGTNKFGVPVMGLYNFDSLRMCLTQTQTNQDYVGTDVSGRWLVYVRGNTVYHLHTTSNTNFWHIDLYQTQPTWSLTREESSIASTGGKIYPQMTGIIDEPHIYYNTDITSGWMQLPSNPNSSPIFAYPCAIGFSRHGYYSESTSKKYLQGTLLTLPLAVTHDDSTTMLLQTSTRDKVVLNTSSGFIKSHIGEFADCASVPSYLPKREKCYLLFDNCQYEYNTTYNFAYITGLLSLEHTTVDDKNVLIPVVNTSKYSIRDRQLIGNVSYEGFGTDSVTESLYLNTEITQSSITQIGLTQTNKDDTLPYNLLQVSNNVATYQDISFHKFTVEKVSRTINANYPPTLIQTYLTSSKAKQDITPIAAPQVVSATNQLQVTNPNSVPVVLIYDTKEVTLQNGQDIYDQRMDLTKALYMEANTSALIDTRWCSCYFVGDKVESSVTVYMPELIVTRTQSNKIIVKTTSGQVVFYYGVGYSEDDAYQDVQDNPKMGIATTSDQVYTISSNEYFAYYVRDDQIEVIDPLDLTFNAIDNGNTVDFTVNRSGTLYYMAVWGEKGEGSSYTSIALTDDSMGTLKTTITLPDITYSLYAYYVTDNDVRSEDYYREGYLEEATFFIEDYSKVQIINPNPVVVRYRINDEEWEDELTIAKRGSVTVNQGGNIKVTLRTLSGVREITNQNNFYIPTSEDDMAITTYLNDTTMTATTKYSSVYIYEGDENRKQSYSFNALPGALLYTKAGNIVTTSQRYWNIIPPTLNASTWYGGTENDWQSIDIYNPNNATVKEGASGTEIAAYASNSKTGEVTYFYYISGDNQRIDSSKISIPSYQNLQIAISKTTAQVTFTFNWSPTSMSRPTVQLHYNVDGEIGEVTLSSKQYIFKSPGAQSVTAYLTYTNNSGKTTIGPTKTT